MTTKAETYKELFIILIAIVFVLLIIKFVYSQPYGPPHQFYGAINCPDGSPTPDGTQLSVKVQGTQIKSTLTSSGLYGYSSLFLIWETDQNSSLDFYISDIYYTTVQFNQGESQKLDFILSSCGSPSTSGGGSSGGGGGGGGGGGSNSDSSNTYIPPTVTKPTDSIIFNNNSPINPSKLEPNISELIGPKFSNILTKPLSPKNSILALDISILALLILSAMVLIVYSKTRSRQEHLN